MARVYVCPLFLYVPLLKAVLTYLLTGLSSVPGAREPFEVSIALMRCCSRSAPVGASTRRRESFCRRQQARYGQYR